MKSFRTTYSIVFLACTFLFPSTSISKSLGKILFATLTEPKPSDTIMVDVFKDETFTIRGIAQRFSPVNVYVYSRVPEKIKNFQAITKDGAIDFSWTPRDIFLFNPAENRQAVSGGEQQYVKITGNIPVSDVFIQHPTGGNAIRKDTVEGTITIMCHIAEKTGTVFWDLHFNKEGKGEIFQKNMQFQAERDASDICKKVDAKGNLSPSFALRNFSFPFLDGKITGDIVVNNTKLQKDVSLFFIKENNEDEIHIDSKEKCPLVIWADASLAISGYKSFFSGDTTYASTIGIFATVNTGDIRCADMDGKFLLGSLPIAWTRTLTSDKDAKTSSVVSCQRYQKEMPFFDCRGISGTMYDNPYKIYDALIGYRDTIPQPGDIKPSADTRKTNSNRMLSCNNPVYFVDTSLYDGTEEYDDVLKKWLIDPACEEILCDVSGCQESFCTDVRLQQCNPPAVRKNVCLNKAGINVVSGELSPCATTDTVRGTGWLTTYIPSQDISFLDTPGSLSTYPLLQQSEKQQDIRDFRKTLNPMSSTSLNYHASGYYLFSYATQTEERACEKGVSQKCGYDVIEDGAANSWSNYPIRDYIVLSDGFQQYEIYALPDDQYTSNEGVTRENGTLLATMKDPSAKTVRARIPDNLKGKKLHIALFEVREGDLGGGRKITPRIPDSLIQPYTDQGGVYGHILTASNEVVIDPQGTVTTQSSPDKFEWEIFAEEGKYDEVHIKPIITDKDEHFSVIGALPEDGNKGLDKYILNRFSDTHIIVATYRSSDTVFDPNNPGTFLLKASRDAMSFLSVKQTGNLGSVSTQSFNLYGVVFDAWTKDILPDATLQVLGTGKDHQQYDEYTTTSSEGVYTGRLSQGTYRIIPLSVHGKEGSFVFPSPCDTNVPPYKNMYCGNKPFSIQDMSATHFDIPLTPTVQGTISIPTSLQQYSVAIIMNNGGVSYATPDGKFSFFLSPGQYTISEVLLLDKQNDITKKYTLSQSVSVYANKTTSVSVSVP